jgi:hypothetical protein
VNPTALGAFVPLRRFVSPLPITFSVPPQSGEGVRESGWRLGCGKGLAEVVQSHFKSPCLMTPMGRDRAATVVVAMIVAVMVLAIMMFIVLVMLTSMLLLLPMPMPMLLLLFLMLLLLIVLSLLPPSASFRMTRRPIQAQSEDTYRS